ncbi:MAG: twin-arginine translocation signal domain-containing protein [Bryobacteraceae bacterium]
MNRRDFLALAGATGAAASAGAAGPQAGTENGGSNAAATPSPYYRFTPDGRECVILRPDTPIPWMNLLTNDDFQTWITHDGHIEAFMLDRELGGLTNPQEVSGFIYIRDQASGEYFAVNRPPSGAAWEAVHGLGYTVMRATALGIASEVTYFVPRSDPVLVAIIDLHNTGASEKHLDLFYTVEWSLGDQNKQIVFRGHGGGGDAFTGGSQFNLYKKAYLDGGILYAEQHVWRTLSMEAKPWPYTGFLASSLPVRSFDCVRSEFVGHDRSLANPIAVERGKCSGSTFWSLNQFPWGAAHNVLRIPGGAAARVVIVIGMTRRKDEAAVIARKYFTAASEQLQDVQTHWRDFTARTTTVETPERDIDREINIWSKYQWRTAMFRSQNGPLYGLGFWSYVLSNPRSGWAVREIAIQPHDPEVVRKSLAAYMQCQFRDYKSHVFSESQPLLLLSDLNQEWPPKPSPEHLRYPHSHEAENAYAFPLYLNETGDLKFLDQTVPFVDGGTGTAFEHMANSVDYSVSALGPHGLPLLNRGTGDWNDELNMISREGKGESVMFAMTACFTLRECAAIANAYGRSDKATEWTQRYEQMKADINRHCWDGDWYLRAFADDAAEPLPIGTAKEKEGRIYLNTQTWAVLSGVADSGRAQACMDAVEKHLLSPYGPMIYAPSYSAFNPHVGVASTYAPGFRNGCIYLRPAGWAIIAACMAGRAELAYRMYTNSVLCRVSRNIERYQHEPYVYAENYVGPDHPLAGMGQYQWCLGEGANWMWHSYVNYILGVRPRIDGLQVDPRIPSKWERFRVRRPFRGAVYDIEVTNPRSVHQGVRSMLIDGRRVSGNLIQPHSDGREHTVKITLEDA